MRDPFFVIGRLIMKFLNNLSKYLTYKAQTW